MSNDTPVLSNVEHILMIVGISVSQHAEIFYKEGQPNIRILTLGDKENPRFMIEVLFDVKELITKEIVRKRVAETCERHISWLSILKEGC